MIGAAIPGGKYDADKRMCQGKKLTGFENL
jgi:hypothetical protein